MDLSELDPRLAAMMGQLSNITAAQDDESRETQYDVLAGMLAEVQRMGQDAEVRDEQYGVIDSVLAEAEQLSRPLLVSWEHLRNADNQCWSKLRLTNQGQTTVSSDWRVYFCFARDIATAAVNAQSLNLILTKEAGDFYSLAPTSSFQLVSNESVEFEFAARWGIKHQTDRPSGFYATDSSGKQLIPFDVFIEELKGGGKPRTFDQNALFEQLESPRLIPKPRSCRKNASGARVQVRSNSYILVNEGQQTTADLLNRFVCRHWGCELQTATEKRDDSTTCIVLQITDAASGEEVSQHQEGYSLQVQAAAGSGAAGCGTVTISGTSGSGLVYGVQSLCQLMLFAPDTAGVADTADAAANEVRLLGSIEAQEIVDWPAFGYRGVHLDVGRNFQSKEQVSGRGEIEGRD
jgi:hexosaminidase